MKLKRLQALLLSAIMIFSMTMNSIPAFAMTFDQDSGLCPHHTEHDEACGYQEGSECKFVCEICDCTCTSLCREGYGNEDCPVCAEDGSYCTFTTVDVGFTFDSRYAQCGEDGGALLMIRGQISGKKITQAKISVSLTDEEAQLLDIQENSDVSLRDNQLTFTITNDENNGNPYFYQSIPVHSYSLATLDISEEDISVSVSPDEYQESSLVDINLAGAVLTLVEKLPQGDEYGSGTMYEAQVEDVTVNFVDIEGKAMPRQEHAPDFELYYQVEGQTPAALHENSLPFGMEEMPEITTKSGEYTWTGHVEDVSGLPSSILTLQDGSYAEKNVTWFLQPSYPDDYYENAGRLVEINDENAADYPAGLGRGWYFIGGMEPFPDDVITVKEYLSSLNHKVYWADNANAEGMRPSDLDGLYELQFAFDGSSRYQALTEDNMKQLGLETIPQPVKSMQGGVWQVDWRNSLPSKVICSDSTGSGTSFTRDVSWRVVFKSAPKQYAMVEVTPENADDYSSVKDQYGTYYVLETNLTFTARIYQGNAAYDAENIREAFLEQFYLDASYTGNKHQYFQLESVRDDGHYKPVENPEDPNLITVTVTNLWRYNLDNTRINYSIREGKSSEEVDNRLIGVSGLEDGDYFAVSYDNSAVPSFSNQVSAVYSGGILKLTLTGKMEYHATKAWLDDGETQRPTATLELWRYRSGQSYNTASLVRDANGDHYVLNLDTVTPNADGTYDIDFADSLPKYDPEGYRYRYAVREYLSGANADRYEQVFGTVAEDGTVTDTLPEYSPRDANDTFLYNGGTLSNRLKGTVPVSVTKDWKAASFQSEFEDVMVELRLQSRLKGQNAEWEDTDCTHQMFGFMAENLTMTYTGNYSQYDALGNELEYRWVEEAVWQGGTVEGQTYTGGHKVPSYLDEDGYPTFVLKQNGREIIYSSGCNLTDGDEKENCTVITNSISNVIDYDVKKEFAPSWNENDYEDSYKFSLFRAVSGSEPVRYATFTIAKDASDDPVEINKYIDDNATLSIEQTEDWHVVIHGLPEFNNDGQQYEYLLLEEDGAPVAITTERDDEANYKSVVTNSPGTGNVILVRKEWVDESDSQHRMPVEITVYDKETNKPVGSSVILGRDTWYALVSIGNRNHDEVYILETKVGDTKIKNPVDENGEPIPPEYTEAGTVTGTAVHFSTQYHDYEATYSYDENFGNLSGDAYKGMHCYTVTNRRLGSINLTVTKEWIDGDGEKRAALQNALESSGLHLAVKLKFMNEPSLGMEQIYDISDKGYLNDNEGDNVTISLGNPTPIQDNQGRQVDSIQLLDLTQKEQTIYFWNLPKYDGNGASVRYTVEEIFVDEDGKEITDLTESKYSDVAEAWHEYAATTETGPYVVGKNHALDTQEFNLTNRLSDTTDVSWYTLWQDDFAYKEGSRPDIYLNIYARIHNADGTTQTKLVVRNYRWEFEEYGDDPEITHQNFWKCTIENLQKYDSFGYEIDYFAVMKSVVSTGDFDYLPTSYAPEEATKDDNVFATADGLLGDDTYENLIVNVSENPEDSNYALMSGNTFVNTIYDTVTFSGEKLWTNLPDGYPLEDLPSVTFVLSRSTADGTVEPNIASMTISGSDWKNLNVNGHYMFEFGYTGVNNPASSFDGENLPEGASLLPRFDSKGRLYNYILTEVINWQQTDAGNEGQTDDIFELSSSGQTFDNSYNLTGNAQLSAKKYLSVPAGQNVYPAIKMVLTRSYITSSGSMSRAETVDSATWTADEVKASVEAQNASSGHIVTVEHTFTFDNLPVYAPNGSKYNYTITEDKNQLGGFSTWAAEGDVTADNLRNDANTGNAVNNLTSDEDIDIDASFLNEPENAPAPVQLTGGKVWKDINDDFRPDDVSKGLSVTLKRSAKSQTGQNNSIPWQEIDISGKITWEQDSANSDRWTYTITGLERYAPNGMPWVYQVTEEPVPYYTASNNGVAGQKAQDNISGNITMNDLVNSMLTSTYFKKTWVDSDGIPIEENILGSDIELEVNYELQLRVKAQTSDSNSTWGHWQSADDYFKDYQELAVRDYSGVIRAALGDSKWDVVYRGTGSSFNNLPQYVMDSTDTVYALQYRVVETEVKVYRTGENDELLLTQTYKAPLDNGDNAYAYTVSDDNLLFSPYYGAGRDTQANGTTTHRNQIDTTGITVAKEWKDDQNQIYKTRPDSTAARYDWEVSFIVQRSIDGGQNWDTDPIKTVTLYGTNAEDVKTEDISGLPRFVFDSDGKLQPCTYRIMELQSVEATSAGSERKPLKEGEYFNDSYTVSYSADGLTAVNTLRTVELYAVKSWNDEEQNHPDIVLELKYLKKGGNPDNPADYKSFVPAAEVELGIDKAEENSEDLFYYAEEDWKAVWKNVPLRMAGSQLDENTESTVYKIFETVAGDYITESETTGHTTSITNTPSVTPSVTKHWLGVTALQEVKVVLYRNTEKNLTAEPVDSAVLTANKNWTHVFDPQPQYDHDGNAYKYWIEEEQIDGRNAEDAAKAGGYAISYDGDVESGFHVYNHKLITVNVIKDWADVSDSEHRPDDLQLILQRTTEANPDEDDWQTVTGVSYTWTKNGNRWQTAFTSLPQYDIKSGQIYKYRVEEITPDGYEQDIISSDSNTFHFKNTRSEFIDIPVQKVWVDNNDKLGYRPDAITVELYADGQPTGQTIELKPGILHNLWNSLTGNTSGWSGVFEDQPKYDENGALIDYSVVEISESEHYMVSYSEKQDGTHVITNKANGNLTVAKEVTGSGDPAEEFHFIVKLSDNTISGIYGEMTFDNGVAEFVLSHGESITASDLPAGISYTVTEKEADKGAYVTQSSGASGTILSGDTSKVDFINNLSRISISVNKNWQDNNDQDGKRPDNITVMLMADGKETGKTLVLSEENNWMGSFTDLDEYKEGEKIVYTVEEEKVDGYETVISGDAVSGFTVTNIHRPDNTEDYLPQTGDKMNLFFWIVMCCAGVLGMLATITAFKHSKNRS